MSTAAASAPRFFRDYNRVIAVAYALILLGLLLFFAWQLRQRHAEEIAVIESQVARHGEFLEFVLRSSTDQLETLRMIAGSDAAPRTRGPRRCVSGAAFPDLREIPGGFNRDAAADKDLGGNVVGVGALRGRNPDFYCDLAAAMELRGSLQGMTFNLPSVVSARFISIHGFHLVSPWRPAADVPFTKSSLIDPAWRLGTPDANPDRARYWITPYFAGEQAGLLAPVAAPVYEGRRFMGVLAVDTSLDYLNRINSDFAYPLGSVAVIDAGGRVLAHPKLYRDPLAVRQPPLIQQLLADEGPATKADIDALVQGKATAIGEALVLRRDFVSAPWQLVYSVPERTVWQKQLREHGPSMVAVLAGLFILMAVTYAITARRFVGPAAKLVDHVVAESIEKPQPMPAVPSTWRPWFEAITRAFRESLQLSSLRREIDIASRLQQSILPRRWPTDPRFQLLGTMIAAKDVGGDFYDHFPVGEGLRGIVVADVSGKGISAGLFGMVSKTHLRAVATRTSVAPGAMVTLANEALCADSENENCMFLTLLYVQYNPATGAAVCVNAGHPPPLLVHADGRIQWLPSSACPMMGVMDGIDYEESTAQLAPGDTLFVFTDGVTEAMNSVQEEFSEPRLATLFDGRPPASPDEAIQRVLAAVREFAGDEEQFDDITCVALRCVALGPANEGGDHAL